MLLVDVAIATAISTPLILIAPGILLLLGQNLNVLVLLSSDSCVESPAPLDIPLWGEPLDMVDEVLLELADRINKQEGRRSSTWRCCVFIVGTVSSVVGDKESGSISPQTAAKDGAEGSPVLLALSKVSSSLFLGSGHGDVFEDKRGMETMELSSLSEEVTGPEEKTDRGEVEQLVRMDDADDVSWGWYFEDKLLDVEGYSDSVSDAFAVLTVSIS